VHFAPPFTIPVIDWLTERRDPDTGPDEEVADPRALVPAAFSRAWRGSSSARHVRSTCSAWTAHRRSSAAVPRLRGATLDALLARARERKPRTSRSRSRACSEHIRGFEQVREAHIEKVRAKQEELLAAYRLHS
jgi:hypothetical protein